MTLGVHNFFFIWKVLLT